MSKKHTVRLIASGEPATFAMGAAGDDGVQGPATFSALAYSGAAVPGYTATPRLPHPYVIDLSGTQRSRSVLVNLEHDATKRVGHVTKVDNDGSHLLVEGVLSAASEHSRQVADSASLGMPWEVSIEGQLSGREFIAAGQKAIVNGREVSGPVFRFTKNTFTDIAFVSRGADEGNAVKVAASAAGAPEMTEFEQFIVSCGADPEVVTTDHRATLQRAFDAMKSGGSSTSNTPFTLAAEGVRKENDRQESIQKMALEAMKRPENRMFQDQIENLAKAALESKTEPRDFELELLRGTRIQPGTFIAHNRSENDPDVIEAAIALSAGMPDVEKHYSEKTLDMVHRSGMRNFGLQQLLLRIASTNGYVCRAGERIHNGNLREILEFCFPPATARLSGFSTISLPGILGNVANKELLMGYMEEDQTWRDVANVKPVSNFHAYTSYRMLDNLEYEEIGPAGEIKHGTLGQESYTRQAKTYARMLGITRTDIINDDLGAFDDLRTRLGRGASKKFNNIFWAAFMDNASFFTTALTNYTEGATTNLGTDGVGLGLGVTAWRKMTTPTADGTKRIGANNGRPSILLVPPELEINARRLYVSANFITGANATSLDANIFQNLYRPVVQNRLSDSAFTGNSTTAWYLIGTELKPMVVSFLNGQQAPTVESSDADFDTLGILFRGFHDFGADKSEYLGALKVKGAA